MRFRSLLLPVFLALIFPGTAVAGNPDSPGPPESTFSLNLEDLYLRLTAGATGTPGVFTEPATAPGTGTMYTIDQIMAVAPYPDNVNGALPNDVLVGMTFWGLRTDGTWGHQTGAYVDPCAEDSDSDGTPDCYDLCPSDPFTIDRTMCGCGNDNDLDGVCNTDDACPNPDPSDLRAGDLCWRLGDCVMVTERTDTDGDGCFEGTSMQFSTGCGGGTPIC